MPPRPWGLPGPSAFLTSLREDLDSGIAVCLEIPLTVDESELESEVADAFSFHSPVHLDATPGTPPLRSVCDVLGIPAAEMPASIGELLQSGYLQDQLVWISGVAAIDDREITVWLELADRIAAWADDHGSQIPIVICLHGDRTPLPLPETPRLRLRRWWNVIGRLDLAVMLASLDHDIDPVTREHIVELAVDDCTLATHLATTPWSEDGWLRVCTERARTLGIDDLTLSNLPPRCTPKNARSAWLRGAVSCVDGASAVHSGVLASAGRVRDLERRRWASQIRCLLPRIDLLRVSLLDVAVERGMIAPWLTGDSEPEVEFKDVSRSLSGRAGLTEHAALANWLHRSRNDLAHLRCLSPDRVSEGRRLANRVGLEWP